jgi:hypothetical protein
LGAVRLDPVGTLHGQPAGVESVERVEKAAHALTVLVHERLAPDQPVPDEEGVARDVLEAGNVHRQGGRERRQQCELELQRLLDAGAPREAEDPLVVHDRDLEVVAGVDLADRSRAAAERACDQP